MGGRPNRTPPRTVERELANVLTLTRWLHPELAMEVLRKAYREAEKRNTAGRTDMLVRGVNYERVS